MIKYEGKEKKYFYNVEDVENVLQIINEENFYNPNNCTQEKITSILNAVDSFIKNIKVQEENAILERHETEEEARTYFGQEFIEKFDKLLTTLDKEQTIVALHGTNVSICPQICENGLQYKSSSLSSTAVQQSMAYGQEDMHYSNYESLLNWGHKNYKGLVIVAVPYECFYKEGLWIHFAETGTSAYGGQDYRIDPDFIVGYIDVEGKNIVINPKYNRQHNYQGYVKDNELFREQLDMNNEKMQQALIDSKKILSKNNAEVLYVEDEDVKNEEFSVEKISDVTENLVGLFNSVGMETSNFMNESKYKYILEEILQGITVLKKALPNLKTDEQVRKEQEEKNQSFNPNLVVNNGESDEFDWGDNIEWDYSIFQDEEQKDKFY